MSYIYRYASIGDYSLPIKVLKVEDILGKYIHFAETESQAVRELYLKVVNHPSNMISHTTRKEALMVKIQEVYIDKFPEVFV
ncbi:MAG: hypothetical protein DRH57_07885 [Candidatus Cloacimonadota bacterium]|nr:MAG: hypothetical protein DRH57_07885 [Candidatus Cloacimonadota bacterium]